MSDYPNRALSKISQDAGNEIFGLVFQLSNIYANSSVISMVTVCPVAMIAMIANLVK